MNITSTSILTYSEQERLLMFLILIILAVFAILGNLVQFLAISLESSLQTASNVFIISLGCSDFGVGVITLPTVALTVYNREWVFSDFACKMTGVVDSVMITASMWTLGFTALDRFFLVQSPICHRNSMTKEKAWKTVLFCWALSFACAILPLLGWSDYSFSKHSMSCAMTSIRGFKSLDKYYFLFYVLVSFPIPLGMIFVCYFIIFRFSVNRSLSGVTLSKPSKRGSSCKPTVLVSNIRTAKITLLLIVFVLACILPTFIIGLFFWFETDIPFAYQTSKAVIWSLLGNSACNPILYGWFNKQFRFVYKQMLLSLLLREKYSVLRRSVMSMKSVHGTPKHSNNSTANTDFINMLEIRRESNFSYSLKLLKKYNRRLNREPRGSMPNAMALCCTTPNLSEEDNHRRHSIAGAGDLYTNNLTLHAVHYRSEPNIRNSWNLTTFTNHK